MAARRRSFRVNPKVPDGETPPVPRPFEPRPPVSLAAWGGRPGHVEDDVDATLTICIPSYAARTETLFRLVRSLQAQPRSNEVEILVATDGGHTVVGAKRNRLVSAAVGRYIVHIDDDDEVAPNYIPAILEAIDANPGVDAICLRGVRTNPSREEVFFDYVVGGVDGVFGEDRALWRTPNHLCPIRAELAKAVPFPRRTRGEDLEWGKAIKPFLRSQARAGAAGEVLYFYRWEPNKPARLPHMAKNHRAIFAPQYTERSGPGSTAEASAPYRAFLERFIRENGIRSIVDLACGDFEIMSLVDRQGADYLGVDVIPERIARDQAKAVERPQEPPAAFVCEDIQAFPIPACDLLLVKDVLQHWSTFDVAAFLRRLREAPFRYALITNCNYGPTVNTDIATGGWRALDVTAPPFGIGEIVFHWETPKDIKDTVLLFGNTAANV